MLDDDPRYAEESILVHEFGHCVMNCGFDDGQRQRGRAVLPEQPVDPRDVVEGVVGDQDVLVAEPLRRALRLDASPCVGFLKIDTQGFDFHVLRGAVQLLAGAGPGSLGRLPYVAAETATHAQAHPPTPTARPRSGLPPPARSSQSISRAAAIVADTHP